MNESTKYVCFYALFETQQWMFEGKHMVIEGDRKNVLDFYRRPLQCSVWLNTSFMAEDLYIHSRGVQPSSLPISLGKPVGWPIFVLSMWHLMTLFGMILLVLLPRS
ncbi:hypothetical protein KSP39_PZI007611 [Platanthera zijinensis]|uniref:Uncharacterized protein n=1 Tax=Platanthera zijinensis TaxID=2320716 RepID=A0AAP0BPK1_9ASPA